MNEHCIFSIEYPARASGLQRVQLDSHRIPRKNPPGSSPASYTVPDNFMPVAQLTLELRIEHAQSLKDRRQVVRSLKDQLKQGFNISVAEMDEAVTWQSATIGVVAISGSRDYLHGLIEEVERAARRMTNELGAELADSFWHYLEE
jgi:uncharacterized protein YlxP (DUF503 family)